MPHDHKTLFDAPVLRLHFGKAFQNKHPPSYTLLSRFSRRRFLAFAVTISSVM